MWINVHPLYGVVRREVKLLFLNLNPEYLHVLTKLFLFISTELSLNKI